MAIVPIIIYRDRKSDKEIHEEMERERKWRELMEKDEVKKQAREERERLAKKRAKLEKEEAARKKVCEAEKNNPWEFRILPDGWKLFGQLSAEPIPWDGTEKEYENLIEDEQ